jgi:hypothetical protein
MTAARQIADDQLEGRWFVFDDDDRHSHGMSLKIFILHVDERTLELSI